MPHVRTQIREAVGAILSASATTWKRVFETRLAPARDVTPYLMVWIDAETIGASTIHETPLQEREMSLTIVARSRVTDGETLEDTLDTMAAEIETTLTDTALRSELSNNNVWLTLKSSSSDLQVEDENERIYAQVALDWEVRLF
ncbi:MAG: hypothetical protein GY942_02510, partial [Aestuariibacter sp.]|nr:hypothetical protein [Aestuariibacter sp.]